MPLLSIAGGFEVLKDFKDLLRIAAEYFWTITQQRPVLAVML